MMTQKEAIHALKEIKDYLESDDASLDCRKAVAGLDFAISALRPVSREQVEKVWRGEWVCAPNMGVYDTICSKCGYCPGITFGDSDFCPACGAPMTDEAVEMVMERMEALHDNRT